MGPGRPGNTTNQLQYLYNTVLSLWGYHIAWPFHEPVDATKLNLPVSYQVEATNFARPYVGQYLPCFQVVPRKMDQNFLCVLPNVVEY